MYIYNIISKFENVYFFVSEEEWKEKGNVSMNNPTCLGMSNQYLKCISGCSFSGHMSCKCKFVNKH